MRLDQKFMNPPLPWEESAPEAASMAARLGRIELGSADESRVPRLLGRHC